MKTSKYLGAHLAQGHMHFFLLVWFYDGLWQTPAVCQIWSRWIYLLREYNGICFSATNPLFQPPFGGVGVLQWQLGLKWFCIRRRVPPNFSVMAPFRHFGEKLQPHQPGANTPYYQWSSLLHSLARGGIEKWCSFWLLGSIILRILQSSPRLPSWI